MNKFKKYSLVTPSNICDCDLRAKSLPFLLKNLEPNKMKELEYFVGVDGSKHGWVAVYSRRSDFKDAKAMFLNNLLDLKDIVSPRAQIIVDIPIGLEPNQSQRPCDKLARPFLGTRSSTLFTPPCCDAIMAADYNSANLINKEKVGAGLSKQSWFLKNKILEARSAISEGLNLKEGHPECSFTAHNGSPIRSNKKSVMGILRRLKCLSEIGFDPERTVSGLEDTKGFKIDDFLDSAILCWTASRVVNGKNFTFPSEIPIKGGELDCVIYV